MADNQRANQGIHHDVELSAEDIESFLGGVLDHTFPDQGIDPSLPQTHATIPTNHETEIKPEQLADARTERKRSREKQRRSDVNKQFSELTEALRRIESESEDWKQLPHTSSTNRADLIARTVSILNSIHSANEGRKRKVMELEKDLEDAKKAGEDAAAKLKDQMMAPHPMSGGRMMMMVPMMIGGDSPPTPYGPFAAAGGTDAAMKGMPGPVMAPTAQGGGQWGQMMPQPYALQNGWGMMPIMPPGQAPVDEKKMSADGSTNEYGGNLAHCA